MVLAASQNSRCKEAIRLVGLSGPCGDRLATALGVARVSAIAIYDDTAPARALVDYHATHLLAGDGRAPRQDYLLKLTEKEPSKPKSTSRWRPLGSYKVSIKELREAILLPKLAAALLTEVVVAILTQGHKVKPEVVDWLNYKDETASAKPGESSVTARDTKPQKDTKPQDEYEVQSKQEVAAVESCDPEKADDGTKIPSKASQDLAAASKPTKIATTKISERISHVGQEGPLATKIPGQVVASNEEKENDIP
ncbi:unnamed protein product [Parascedosporium putredinis]|uniref:Uncharacterized protein n=1 Tax=Parascedosporium putredinis TaxID=1442378 RepID=A0A9P1HBN7_9PEZI|nr:unnamed protein product [Parascedosporium putredinis]CAI8002428.1 unnamed protein product [Parascedosporium putredinis]